MSNLNQLIYQSGVPQFLFAGQLLGNNTLSKGHGRASAIYEYAYQQRDFVHMTDVAHACRPALEPLRAAGDFFLCRIELLRTTTSQAKAV